MPYDVRMDVSRTVAEVRQAVLTARAQGRSIHLVPTMGALHEGHLSLVRAARGPSQFVVVSIFVNPTQFGPNEDFTKYPRPIETDLAACRDEGVDVVFMPSPEEMYRPGANTTVHVAGLTETLCGPHRPGHFDGVATVVTKLFNIVQPDRAYFGQKDAQQAVIIRRMVADLDMPIEIIVCPIVREPDGVAMSSRNAYLSPEHRKQARCLSESLRLAERMVREGERRTTAVVQAMRSHITAAGPCTIDYIAAVDPETLQPIETIDRRCMVALAVRIGSTRLIDNLVIEQAR
jgi:pantoate--beta-alanine ligase